MSTNKKDKNPHGSPIAEGLGSSAKSANQDTSIRSNMTNRALGRSRKSANKSPNILSRFFSGKIMALSSARSLKSAESVGVVSDYRNVGLIEQLQLDNVLSMRWRVRLDTRTRKRNLCGLLVSMLLSSVFIFTYLILFTHLPETEYFALDRTAIKDFADDREGEALALMIFSISVFILLFIFDLHNGGVIQQKIAYFGYLVAAVLFFGTFGLLSRNLVAVPIVVFVISCPLLATAVKSTFFLNMDHHQFVVGLMIPLCLALGISLIIMGIYIPLYRWDVPAVRSLYFRQIGCKEFDALQREVIAEIPGFEDIDLDDRRTLDDLLLLDSVVSREFNTILGELVTEFNFTDADEENCLVRAFILFNGFANFVVLAFVIIWFVSETLRVSYTLINQRVLGNLSSSFQVFLLLAGLVSFAAWVVATVLPDENIDYSTLLLFFIFVAGGLTGFLFYYILELPYIQAQLDRTPIGKRLLAAAQTDLMIAALVYFLAPLFLVFAIVSIPTQWIRKNTSLGKTIMFEAEKEQRITKEVQDVWMFIYQKDLGIILHNCLLIGILYFVLAIFFGRFTTFILAIVGSLLDGASLGVATAVFVTVGLLMFLLPPVPGLPVYLFGGVILFPLAEPIYGFIGGLLYAILVSFVLKLLAVAVEQKVIGECFGSNSVTIKSMVGINQPSLKAIKYILKTPGNYVAKVAILCGGPDWPTSVVTGIMKLRLLPMLVGTFPVILLVACASAAGAFLVVDSGTCLDENFNGNNIEDCDNFEPDELITNIRGLLLGLMIVMQAVLFLLAFHCIGKVVDAPDSMIDSIPDDLVVVEHDRKNKEKNYELARLRSWNYLDKKYKILHCIMVPVIVVANFIMQGAAAEAFEVIEPTDDPISPLKPLGVALFALISFPIGYFFIFNRIILRRYKQLQ